MTSYPQRESSIVTVLLLLANKTTVLARDHHHTVIVAETGVTDLRSVIWEGTTVMDKMVTVGAEASIVHGKAGNGNKLKILKRKT